MAVGIRLRMLSLIPVIIGYKFLPITKSVQILKLFHNFLILRPKLVCFLSSSSPLIPLSLPPSSLCASISPSSSISRYHWSTGQTVSLLSNQLTNVEEVQAHLSELTVLGELVLFCFKFDQLKVCIPSPLLSMSHPILSPFSTDAKTRDPK